MSFPALYRVSFYAMLFSATLVLSIDISDIGYAMLYPAAVAVAGAVAFLTVDRNRTLAVSNLSLNLLGLLSIPLAGLEYALTETNILVLALGHWLVYLQLILMFRPKTVMEDWELFLLGLVQVMVGAVISQSDVVGMALFAWAVLSLWVLGLFSLRRDAFRARGLGRRAAPRWVVDDDAYPGLLNTPFLVSCLRVTLTTLALGGVIFLAMPRRSGATRSAGVENLTQHLTGFDDEVQLGQLGEILENDSVVMSVELLDESGRRVAPDGEPLWRGVTMAKYEKGRWFRQARRPTTFPFVSMQTPTGRGPVAPRKVIRQLIKLESNDSNVLFGLRPMIDAASSRRYGSDWLNSVDGTISRVDVRPGAFDYEVKSFVDPNVPQPGESRPDAFSRRTRLLGVPDAIAPQLRAIGDRVIAANVPPAQRADVRAKARALEAYLRSSGEFTYTLKLEVKDPRIDPVLDFLVNRKQGHCEYFGSALTLLLRAQGIPSRMVNGFKGGDWNELARILSVRQKHAHTWTEAYLGDDNSPDHLPVWLTLDPTPGGERDRAVALVSGIRGYFRQLTDLVRYLWVFYVVGYNAERQNRLLYQPILNLVAEARRGFGIMAVVFAGWYAWLLRMLHFESRESFISWRGFVVSFVGLLVLSGLVRAAVWVAGRVVRRLRGREEESLALTAGASHYRRLAALLAGYGLERPPAETPEEYARRATVFLTARGSGTGTVADVPRLVVDAYYRVRFGHLEIDPQALNDLDSRLDALEHSFLATQA